MACGGSAAPVTPLAATTMVGESVLRIPREGGTATLLRPDLRGTINYRIPGVPALRRTIAASLEDRTVYTTDSMGRLINLDLLAGRCCTQVVRAHGYTGTPSGEVLGFDSTRHAVRISNRALKSYRASVVGNDVSLIRGPGTQVIALSPTAGIAQVLGEDGELRRIKIPNGEVASTWYGELFAVVTPDGLQLNDPTGKRPVRTLSLRGGPSHAIFSPSGHRIYVAREKRKDLVMLDRFSGSNLGTIELPDSATALRGDRTGRWLLARAGKSDSIWVVDAASWGLVATLQTPWDDDLPAVTAGKNLLVRRGRDVVSLDLSTPQLSQVAKLSGAASDIFLPLAWVPKGSPQTPPERATVATATPDGGVPAPPPPAAASGTTAGAAAAAPESGFFIQVSSSQNSDWAKALSQQLRDGGYPARVLNPDSPDGGYRVVVGPFLTREEADAAGKRLGRSYFILPAGSGGN